MLKKTNNNVNIPIIMIMTSLIILVAAMVFAPQAAYSSALLGLNLWWEVVTPALLPFFFISELLLELNISRYLTRAMSPLMEPIFALPGCAALGVGLGFCSGFPSGASIAASLRRRGEITREEAERMVCFTNNAGPLYISVAVAGGLLSCPAAALVLAIAHYGTNLCLGILLGIAARLRGRKTGVKYALPATVPAASPHVTDLGNTVKTAASRAAANITSIGCLMIFFSVLNGFFTDIPIHADPLISGAIQGFWEMSLGVNALANSELLLNQIIPAVAGILGFGGISVQMQVLAMIGDTDIRFWPYGLCRIIHGIISYAAASILCGFMSLPTIAALDHTIYLQPMSIMLFSLKATLVVMGIIFGISLIFLALTPVFRKYSRHKN